MSVPFGSDPNIFSLSRIFFSVPPLAPKPPYSFSTSCIESAFRLSRFTIACRLPVSSYLLRSSLHHNPPASPRQLVFFSLTSTQ